MVLSAHLSKSGKAEITPTLSLCKTFSFHGAVMFSVFCDAQQSSLELMDCGISASITLNILILLGKLNNKKLQCVVVHAGMYNLKHVDFTLLVCLQSFYEGN